MQGLCCCHFPSAHEQKPKPRLRVARKIRRVLDGRGFNVPSCVNGKIRLQTTMNGSGCDGCDRARPVAIGLCPILRPRFLNQPRAQERSSFKPSACISFLFFRIDIILLNFFFFIACMESYTPPGCPSPTLIQADSPGHQRCSTSSLRIRVQVDSRAESVSYESSHATSCIPDL